MKLIKIGSLKLERFLNDPRFLVYIERPIELNYAYDVPYLCGYSKDGRTVYIDRHLKCFLRYHGKVFDCIDFLLVHEITEKALIDVFKLHYQQAHHIATHVESLAVQQHGLNWWFYSKFLKPQIKTADHERVRRIPPNLDLTPYEDEKEKRILQELKRGKRINNKPIPEADEAFHDHLKRQQTINERLETL